MPKRPFFTIAFFIWLAFITYSSLTSFEEIDTGSFGFDIPHADKIVHFIFYSTAAFLGVFYLREQRKWALKQRKVYLMILLFTIAYGILIEVFQYSFTLDRQGDIFDALANSLGSICGILASKFIFSKSGFIKWIDGID